MAKTEKLMAPVHPAIKSLIERSVHAGEIARDTAEGRFGVISWARKTVNIPQVPVVDSSSEVRMAREAGLFESSKGLVLKAYFLLKSGGSANIPPNWIERARLSRKNRESSVASLLKRGRVQDFLQLEDWELKYRKECFYKGLRALLELERAGKTKL
jgi:hypothetical protein